MNELVVFGASSSSKFKPFDGFKVGQMLQIVGWTDSFLATVVQLTSTNPFLPQPIWLTESHRGGAGLSRIRARVCTLLSLAPVCFLLFAVCCLPLLVTATARRFQRLGRSWRPRNSACTILELMSIRTGRIDWSQPCRHWVRRICTDND